ncbi:MAG: hypothetical protein QOK02_4488 [Mycobacterium sp.]|nr:hypothetical protein [Mycobacterium sp.]
MKILVAAGLLVGCAMVYEHCILGVLVLIAAAWAVPIVIHQIHEDHTAVERRR